MKNIIYLLAMLFIALCSCVNSIEDDDDTISNSSTVSIKTNLYQFSEMGNKASLSDLFTRLSIWIMDVDGNKIVEVEQTAEDAGFGSLEKEVPYGEYSLVIVGHSGGKAALINAQKEISFQEVKLTDTFLYHENIVLTEDKDCEVNAVMKRATAKFSLRATDAIPVGVATMVMKITGGGTRVNAETGLAVAEEDQERIISIPEQYVGETGSQFSFFIFMPEAEKKIEISTAVKNTNGEVVYERAFSDVPIKINHTTTYSGRFFKKGSGMSITLVVVSEWGPPITGEF